MFNINLIKYFKNVILESFPFFCDITLDAGVHMTADGYQEKDRRPREEWESVKAEAEKRGCRRVSWEDWKKIDSVEKSKGKEQGRERVKFTNIKDMLAVLD